MNTRRAAALRRVLAAVAAAASEQHARGASICTALADALEEPEPERPRPSRRGVLLPPDAAPSEMDRARARAALRRAGL